MYYEINVSLNGEHYFATSSRSITTAVRYGEILELFREKFPQSEGYKISATYHETRNYIIYDDGVEALPPTI